MDIITFFTNNGIPAIGLTPTIRIRRVSTGALLVTDAAMTEVGDGFYRYTFSTYDPSIDYAIRCDGGILLSGSERYQYAGNENAAELDSIQDDIIEVNTNILGVSGSVVNIDFSSLQVDIDKINTNILSLSGDIALLSDDLKRTLGLMHENIFIDNPTYDSDGNMIGARVRIYSNAGSVGTASNVIGTYTITSVPDGPGKFTSWQQVRL